MVSYYAILRGNIPKTLPDAPVFFPGHFRTVACLSLRCSKRISHYPLMSVDPGSILWRATFFALLLLFFLSSARLQSSHGFDPRQHPLFSYHSVVFSSFLFSTVTILFFSFFSSFLSLFLTFSSPFAVPSFLFPPFFCSSSSFFFFLYFILPFLLFFFLFFHPFFNSPVSSFSVSCFCPSRPTIIFLFLFMYFTSLSRELLK